MDESGLYDRVCSAFFLVFGEIILCEMEIQNSIFGKRKCPYSVHSNIRKLHFFQIFDWS